MCPYTTPQPTSLHFEGCNGWFLDQQTPLQVVRGCLFEKSVRTWRFGNIIAHTFEQCLDWSKELISYGWTLLQLPLNSFLDERVKIERITWNNQLKSLSDDRQPHGTRRQNPVTCWVPPFVYPVSIVDNKHSNSTQYNCPHFLVATITNTEKCRLWRIHKERVHIYTDTIAKRCHIQAVQSVVRFVAINGKQLFINCTIRWQIQHSSFANYQMSKFGKFGSHLKMRVVAFLSINRH